eukprot:245009_1
MAQAQQQKPIPVYGKNEVKGPKVCLLWSSLASNAHQTAAQTKMSNLFVAKGLRLEQLDGAQGENKDLRNKLFNASEVRGKYPQIFLIDENDKITYIGMDDQIDYLVDSETFDATFKCTLDE